MSKNDLPGNTRLWAVIVLIAVFIIGAASGAALWHALMAGRMPLPPMMGPVAIHALDLSDEQRQKVDKIYESYRPQLDAVLAETFPKVRAINEKIEKTIMPLLTAEQKKRFEEMKSKRPPGPMRGPGMHPGMHPDMLGFGPPRLHDAPPPGEPFGSMPPPDGLSSMDGPPLPQAEAAPAAPPAEEPAEEPPAKELPPDNPKE